VEQFERIRREHREEEVSIRELARRHGVHRRAVRQALAAAVPPPRQAYQRTKPIIGPHAATIARWLTEDQAVHRKQRHTARRIWERLVDEEGAVVSEPTVRRYVRACRRELGLERVDVAIVALHHPGDEAQVDFGLADVFIGGERTQVAVFELRLSHSGAAVHVAHGSEGQEAFLEGHVTAFARLGGVPARIRYDNARALVARVLRGRDRAETERFTALRSHYGFDSFFCIPGERGAHEKGGIEGEVGRQRRRFFVPVPRVKSCDCGRTNLLCGHLDPTLAHRVHAGLRAVVHRQLAQDGAHVVLDGLLADRQGVGGLLVGHPLGDVIQDLHLARGERRENRRSLLAVCRQLAEVDVPCLRGEKPCLEPDLPGVRVDEAQVIFRGLCAACAAREDRAEAG
jgi:transposase